MKALRALLLACLVFATPVAADFTLPSGPAGRVPSSAFANLGTTPCPAIEGQLCRVTDSDVCDVDDGSGPTVCVYNNGAWGQLGSSIEPDGSLFVQESCNGAGPYCRESIQTAIDELELNFSDGNRLVRAMMPVSGQYIEDVNCDLLTGHTLISGVVAGTAYSEASVTIEGDFNAATPTMYVANCSLENLTLKLAKDGLGVPAAQTVFETAPGNIGKNQMTNVWIMGAGGVGGVTAGSRLIDHNASQMMSSWTNVFSYGLCVGGANDCDSNTILNHFEASVQGLHGSWFIWDGGWMDLDCYLCQADATTLHLEQTHADMMQFNRLKIGAVATNNGPMTDGNTAISYDDEGVFASFSQVHMAENEYPFGRFIAMKDSEGDDFGDAGPKGVDPPSEIRFDGVSGLNTDKLQKDSDWTANASVRGGTHIMGKLDWYGSSGGEPAANTVGADQCFPGWTYTDLTPPAGKPALWLCVDDTTGGGAPGVWRVAVDASTGYAEVREDCEYAPFKGCFTAIQPAVNYVEANLPAGHREVITHPKSAENARGLFSTDDAYYVEDVRCCGDQGECDGAGGSFTPDGHTILRGYGPQRGYQGGAALRGTPTGSLPTLTLDHCEVHNFYIEGSDDRTEDVVLIPGRNVDIVSIVDSHINPYWEILADGGHCLNVQHTDGFVYVIDSTIAAIDNGSGTAADSCVYVNQAIPATPGSLAVFWMDGSDINIITGDTAGLAAVELVNHRAAIFDDISLACQGSSTCIEWDDGNDDDVDPLNHTSVDGRFTRVSIFGGANGKLLELKDGNGGDELTSKLLLSDFSGLDTNTFSIDSDLQATALFADGGDDIDGTLRWTGPANGNIVANTSGADNCIAGWQFTDTGSGDVFVCKDNGTGLADTWGRAGTQVVSTLAELTACLEDDTKNHVYCKLDRTATWTMNSYSWQPADLPAGQSATIDCDGATLNRGASDYQHFIFNDDPVTYKKDGNHTNGQPADDFALTVQNCFFTASNPVTPHVITNIQNNGGMFRITTATPHGIPSGIGGVNLWSIPPTVYCPHASKCAQQLEGGWITLATTDYTIDLWKNFWDWDGGTATSGSGTTLVDTSQTDWKDDQFNVGYTITNTTQAKGPCDITDVVGSTQTITVDAGCPGGWAAAAGNAYTINFIGDGEATITPYRAILQWQNAACSGWHMECNNQIIWQNNTYDPAGSLEGTTAVIPIGGDSINLDVTFINNRGRISGRVNTANITGKNVGSLTSFGDRIMGFWGPEYCDWWDGSVVQGEYPHKDVYVRGDRWQNCGGFLYATSFHLDVEMGAIAIGQNTNRSPIRIGARHQVAFDLRVGGENFVAQDVWGGGYFPFIEWLAQSTTTKPALVDIKVNDGTDCVGMGQWWVGSRDRPSFFDRLVWGNCSGNPCTLDYGRYKFDLDGRGASSTQWCFADETEFGPNVTADWAATGQANGTLTRFKPTQDFMYEALMRKGVWYWNQSHLRAYGDADPTTRPCAVGQFMVDTTDSDWCFCAAVDAWTCLSTP